MRRYWEYLKYVMRHKWYVFQACGRLKVPLLIGLIHDWDKFLPYEFVQYARTFYKPDGSKHYAVEKLYYAWNSHQMRNKHHWQYWVLLTDRGAATALEMPDLYIREMVADWIGAGRAIGKPDTLAWYQANKDNIHLHSKTRQRVEELLYLYCWPTAE